MRIVVMGVSGCGKSTLGHALAERLAISYYEGDALHPPANVEKMRSGIPLDDEDRWPWLDQVGATLSDHATAVVTCSALKRSYRDRIQQRAMGRVSFVHLAGSRDLIVSRMVERKGHYMPLSLLDSQFATLEAPEPDEALTLDIALPFDTLVETAVAYVKGQS